jgi:hypothetical protein
VRDPIALLDHEQIDEARERVAEQTQVALPVARRVSQRAHLVEGERQRGAVALAGGQAQVEKDPARVDPGRRRAPHGRHHRTRRS